MNVSIFLSPFDSALQAQQIDDAIAQKYETLVV
jgi:ABC-type sugar transport system substrate-binding protein